MLKSMKNKLVGVKKAATKNDPSAEEASNSKQSLLRAVSSKASSAVSGKALGSNPAPAASSTSVAHPAKAPAAPEKRAEATGVEIPPVPVDTNPFSEPLPSFRDVPNQDRQILFVRKLHLCTHTFDFSDSSKNAKEKEMKRQTLLEVVDYVNTGTGKFNEAVFEDITKMLAANLFRTLPPTSHENSTSDSFDPEEEEPTMEPAWPHLQIVYEFLLRYVVSNETDAKVAKKYMDQLFVLRLLDLFDSEDPRERDYLKTILHRIYGKFMVHRPFIRKAINNIFYRFIFETERHNGIAELLEILGSIINGFALPLKEEHKQFLVRALIPLHKPKTVSMYHQQLSYCITQFVEKDPKLADVVIKGLLKYWPLTNSQKEVLFLGELEEVLELTQVAEFQTVMVPLFQRMARCLNSLHFQVAERALFLWNNDYIVSLMAQNRADVLPIIFSSIELNLRSHWNQAVHGLTVNVKKMFEDMDKGLCDECQQRFALEEKQAPTEDERRAARWRQLEDAAQSGGGATSTSASAPNANSTATADGLPDSRGRDTGVVSAAGAGQGRKGPPYAQVGVNGETQASVLDHSN